MAGESVQGGGIEALWQHGLPEHIASLGAEIERLQKEKLAAEWQHEFQETLGRGGHGSDRYMMGVGVWRVALSNEPKFPIRKVLVESELPPYTTIDPKIKVIEDTDPCLLKGQCAHCQAVVPALGRETLGGSTAIHDLRVTAAVVHCNEVQPVALSTVHKN